MSSSFSVNVHVDYQVTPAGQSVQVVAGYDINRYPGAGTGSVIVGRKINPSKKTPWGAQVEELWETQEEAQAAADRANAGNCEGIAFASYSDD